MQKSLELEKTDVYLRHGYVTKRSQRAILILINFIKTYSYVIQKIPNEVN